MNCPYCGGKSRVVDNTYNPKDQELYRLRECKTCEKRFYTIETLIKRDTDRQKKEANK